jgi:hypothetical protein
MGHSEWSQCGDRKSKHLGVGPAGLGTGGTGWVQPPISFSQLRSPCFLDLWPAVSRGSGSILLGGYKPSGRFFCSSLPCPSNHPPANALAAQRCQENLGLGWAVWHLRVPWPVLLGSRCWVGSHLVPETPHQCHLSPGLRGTQRCSALVSMKGHTGAAGEVWE